MRITRRRSHTTLLRRLLAGATLLVLAGSLALVPARGDYAGNHVWMSPASGGLSFSEASTQTDPAMAANALATDGGRLAFLNLNGGFGTGKLMVHANGADSSVAASHYGEKEVPYSGSAFALKGEVSTAGHVAYTTLSFNPLTFSYANQLDVVRTNGYGGYIYAYHNSTKNDITQCITDNGRYIYWIAGPETTDENGVMIGGRLFKMDSSGTSPNPFTNPKGRPSSGITHMDGTATQKVTSASCDSTGNRYAYSYVDGTTHSVYVKRDTTTWQHLTALPAPFDTPAYPDNLVVRVIDMSPNGNWLALQVSDSSGTIDFGNSHYYAVDITTVAGTTWYEVPDAPGAEPDFELTSMGDDGTAGIAQRNVPTAAPPRVVHMDTGEVIPLAPAEVRFIQYAIVSGNGLRAVYPTATAAAAGDTNGVDDFVMVDILEGQAGGTLPTANGGPDKTVNEGANVTINASSSSSNDVGQILLSYDFDLHDDGTIDQSGASPQYQFVAGDGPAADVVSVTVTDSDGTSPEDLVNLTINNVAPVIGFAGVSPTVGNAGATSFSYSAIAADVVDPISYAWDFDGDTVVDSTQPAPTHVFASAGVYSGTLTVDDGDGASATASIPTVTVNSGGGGNLPTAAAGPDQTVNEGASVTLNGAGSTPNDAGQSIIDYIWDRGLNGTDQTGPQPTYQFTAGDGPSSVSVGLRVTDPDGTSPQDAAVVTVQNVAPTITSATVTPLSGLAGSTQFTHTVSANDPADTLTYTWDFDGNGSTDYTGATPPARTFSTPGTYTGTVTVNDGDGGTDTDTLPAITVNGNPPVADAGPSQTVNEGANVTVNASGSTPVDPGQSISNYAFNLDDDGDVEQSGPSATFSFPAGDGPATRTVALTVTDPDGTADDSTTITVQNVAPTVSAATVTPTVGVVDTTAFNYSVTASDPADTLTYTWDFDGNGSTDYTGATPPARTFSTPGTYTGTVTANDGDGGVTARNLPAVQVNPVGGGGGPTDDDDGDGVINLLDAAPQSASLSKLSRLCGSGQFTGVSGGTGRLGGCVSETNFLGIKLLTGSLSLYDTGISVQTMWFLSSRAVKTAPNAAYYAGSAIGGFSFQTGLVMYNYRIAVFDNGPSGDTIAVRVTGGGKNYLYSAPLDTGDFTVG
ncbi:MAG: PKD domain-containing protein [Acidimicrobiia bacterium]|nr:PKD domain-containing protein [Acidimicrobiia bacterium]